jgi:hypothetical protein
VHDEQALIVEVVGEKLTWVAIAMLLMYMIYIYAAAIGTQLASGER